MQILHLIFSWSSFISWLMLLGDIFLIAYLSLRAYRDGMFPRTLSIGRCWFYFSFADMYSRLA